MTESLEMKTVFALALTAGMALVAGGGEKVDPCVLNVRHERRADGTVRTVVKAPIGVEIEGDVEISRSSPAQITRGREP